MISVDDHPSIPKVIDAQSAPDFEYEKIQKGDKIGVGGEANVYRATVTENSETFEFALKEPRFEGTVQTEVFERFEEEAETWSGLDDHQNIVTVYGFGAKSIPWLALEYMDGGTLAERIDKIEFEEALWLAGRVAEGVRYGHRHGVAHLDLKPSNVLLRETPDGTWDYPKVSDWGLAKMLLERSESVEGLSPTYAAPEQFNADEYGRPDDITDIYQFGAVAYELLTGQPPFTGSPTEVMQSVLERDPAKLSEVNPDLPAEIDDIILKALTKDKDDRYDSILLFQKQLDQLFYDYATDLDVNVEPPESPDATLSINSSDDSSSGSKESREVQTTDEKTDQQRSKFASRRAILATVGLGAVGGGLFATQSPAVPISNLLNGGGSASSTTPSVGGAETLSRDSFEEIWGESYDSFVLAGETNFYLKDWVSEKEWGIMGLDYVSGDKVFETDVFDDNRYRKLWDSSSLELDSENLYVGTTWHSNDTAPNNAKLITVSRNDGSLQWEFETPPGGKHNRITHVQSASGNTVLFVADWNLNTPASLDSENPLIFALDKNTGEELWHTSHSSEHVFDISDIYVHGNEIFVTDGSVIDVLDIETGELKDRLAESGSPKFIISDGVLYNFDTSISAFKLSDKSTVWETEPPGAEISVAVGETESHIYAATNSNNIFEISKSTGEINWSTPVVGDIAEFPNALTISDSTIWASDHSGNVYVLDRGTGEQIFSLSDEQEQYYRPTTSIGDVIFVGGTSSRAYEKIT